MNITKIRKLIACIMLTISIIFTSMAQESNDEKLSISGSVDTYFTHDFSGNDNIGTSFADERNSVNIGMIDIALSQTFGKASFVGELSFGPRSFKSIPLLDLGDGDEVIMGIQNLYISYSVTEKISLTAGYMGTFVGYEVISPIGNFNYSTSYLFTNGPFQNSGIKADVAITEKLGLMVGLFNDWNVYSDKNGMTDIGAQLSYSPLKGWDIYLNFVSGSPSGTILDITTGYQITGSLYIGLNAADYNISGDGNGGYSGIAIYPQYAFSETFSLGIRGEYFGFKEYKDESGTIISESEKIIASTITGNFKAGNFTFIPEIRLDAASDNPFININEKAVPRASQFTLAAIYSF